MNDRLSPRETILIIIIAVLAETPVTAFLVYIIWFAGER